LATLYCVFERKREIDVYLAGKSIFEVASLCRVGRETLSVSE